MKRSTEKSPTSANQLLRRAPAALVAVLTLSACTSTPPILPQRDFDRPTDVTFVCMGALPDREAPPNAQTDGGAPTPLVLTGRPMRWCHARNAADPLADAQHRTFAFLPNSNSGELAVLDTDNWKLVDLDPQIAGFNQAPLGVLPEQIASSDDGCRVVTVNHGSCDLSLVDPAALLAPTLHAVYADVPLSTGNQTFTQIQPRTASGRVLPVRVGELAFVPVATDLPNAPVQHLCRSNWTGQAVVTFPSCHLVALIDLPSGQIRDSYYVRRDGDGAVHVEPAGREPVCKVVDCGGPAALASDAGSSTDASDGNVGSDAVDATSDAANPTSDAGSDGSSAVSDAGGDADGSASGDAPPMDDAGVPGDAATAGDGVGAAEAGATAGPPTTDELSHPSGLAINPTSMRAYVGLSDAPFILGFDLQSTTLTPAGGAGNLGIIPLSEDAVGASRLRLSIDPYLDGQQSDVTATAGNFVGTVPPSDSNGQVHVAPDVGDRKYLYVIARDGSVRVIQVSRGVESECETNVDPGAPSLKGMAADNACLPPDQSYRRPTAVGPGIRVSSPPVDVAVADIASTSDHSETSVGGVFAWILGANGNVNLVNINPVWRATAYFDEHGADHQCLTPELTSHCQPESLPPPNTLRDRNVMAYTPALDSLSGPARLDFAPASPVTGPRLQSIWTLGTKDNAAAYSAQAIQTGVFFPENSQPAAQTWSVTWEGPLLSQPRFSGQINVDPKLGTASLLDPGMDFCRAGLLPNDLVTIRGCVDDTECGLGKTCAQGTVGVQGAGGLPIGGLCLATDTSPDQACGQLVNSVRRYEALPVLESQTQLTVNQVRLVPHRDELVLPNRVHCTPPSVAVDGGADAADAAATPDADAAPTDAGPTDAAADASSIDGAGASGAAAAGESAGDLTRDTLLMKDVSKGGLLPTSCVDPADPSTDNFQCIDERCLQTCTKPGQTSGCRVGRICVRFPAGTTKLDAAPCGPNECFCADGPDLTKVDAATCLGELLPYQLSVSGAYLVSGSRSGVPITQLPDANNLCAEISGLDPRVAARISFKDTAWCDATTFDESYDGRCNPNATLDVSDAGLSGSCSHPEDPRMAATKNDWDLLVSLAKTSPAPKNPCFFVGGANDSDAPAVTSRRHVQAMFRNEEIQFMMTNFEEPSASPLQLRFDVSGGFSAQTVGLPATVELGMPARIVVGPFDSRVADTTQPVGGLDSLDVPYLFVVDQRRLGHVQGSSATRGQLLRIHPRGNAVTIPAVGSQPIFQDLTLSINLFPIQ